MDLGSRTVLPEYGMSLVGPAELTTIQVVHLRVPLPLQEVGDLPLGIFEDSTYEQATQQLEKGDVLVLFTDGIIEAADHEGEMFGEARLIADDRH